MENLSIYFVFDDPVPYKKLKIYPVKVKEYHSFNLYATCLLIEKNAIPDPNIIRMTELEYIYYISSSQNEKAYFPYILFFDRLLSLVLNDKDFTDENTGFADIEKSILRYKYNEKGKPTFTIDGEIYDSSDFEEIKKIIAEQNLLELPDENISKEVRDSLEKAREYKRKLSGEAPANFEDYLVALSVATSWTLDHIYNMSIRKFTKSIQRYDNMLHYKIYLSASMSGFVEFKDKSFIKHWLSNLDEKDKYKDVSLDYNALQKKISLESAKK